MYIFDLISAGYRTIKYFIVSILDKKTKKEKEKEKIYRKDMHFKNVIILKQHLTSNIESILGIVL